MSATFPQSTTTWQFDGRIARLAFQNLKGEVDVAMPARGVRALEFGGAPLDSWLLAVDVEASPDDAYARGDDLVVTYRETTERPFTVQVYWSAMRDCCATGVVIDATVSIQTRSWEAYPRVVVSSSIKECEPAIVDAGVALMRPAGIDWTYAEIAPTCDFTLTGESQGGVVSATRWEFADEFMERGVIRRLRVRGAFVSRRGDVDAALALRNSLLSEQPPLTA